jgi:hypothetical protein
MRSVIALAALCLLCTGSLHAGVVLDTGIASFQLDQPVPGLMEKLGPLLDAAGTEELRVAAVIERPGEAELLERWQSPRTIKLVQFIRGREVRDGFVTISFDAVTPKTRDPMSRTRSASARLPAGSSGHAASGSAVLACRPESGSTFP